MPSVNLLHSGAIKGRAWGSKCDLRDMSKPAPLSPTAASPQQPAQDGHGRQEGERAEAELMERLEVGNIVINFVKRCLKNIPTAQRRGEGSTHRV